MLENVLCSWLWIEAFTRLLFISLRLHPSALMEEGTAKTHSRLLILFLVDNHFKSTNKMTLPLWRNCSYIDQFICFGFEFPISKYEIDISGADFVGKVSKKCPSSIVEADDFGWIPLHYAAHLGNLEVVELLLEVNHSSITYVKDNEGMSALHIAAKEGHVNVMKSIVTKCLDTCELLDDRERTAFHVAVESRKKNAVKFFLQTLAFQDLINEQDK
ncbi:Transmembrane protein [Parasponia andersonii]|uniref:Transmembrane protein n=1 Tax=Parasponia andersonii TaxID=3476 RepID=A0A2P5BBC2_PARAD|nr:Transmembrane protein [Parasponia andersonii]